MNTLLICDSFILKSAIVSLLESSIFIGDIDTIEDINRLQQVNINKKDIIFICMRDFNYTHLEQIKEIKLCSNNIKVVFIDLNKEKKKEVFLGTIKIGIEGYISEIDNIDDFNYIIETIKKGRKFYDSNLMESMITSYFNSQKNEHNLTYREKEILDEMSKGYTNKVIASKLYITEYTVKKHISSILNKLDLRNRKEAIIYYKDNYAS